jgi:hypothetical protein
MITNPLRRSFTMKLTDITTSGKPVPVTAKQVAALEEQWWITFPKGYREFITKFGEGLLGDFIRIHPPWRIENELATWRGRIAKHWFWGKKILPQARGLECVIVGDSLHGDELVFHPSRPDLFVLPRDRESVFVAGTDVLSAIEWMLASGKIVKKIADRGFAPFDSRKEAKPEPGKPTDPEGESLDEIVEMGRQWAKRRSVAPKVKADLKKFLGAGMTSTPLFEAIIVAGEYPLGPGYAALHHILDKTGADEGLFAWHMDDDSHGFSFDPITK